MIGETTSFQKEYKAFEDRFRGSPELIRQRLSVYLPLLNSFGDEGNCRRRAVDLGSGRGEWLNLISEHGWQGLGVDSNSSFAASAKELGVTTEISDGLSFLKACQAESFDLITAFHVVEHVSADYRSALFSEIYRVLTPGGLMIIETPNPQNVTVGTWSFHMDPTHISPIPPPLLQYQVEAAGFPASAVILRNGDLGSTEGDVSQVLSVLLQSGPDYAVVSRKVPSEDDDRIVALREFAAACSQPNPADVGALLALAGHADTRVIDIERRARELHEQFASHFQTFESNQQHLTEALSYVRQQFDKRMAHIESEIAALSTTLESAERRFGDRVEERVISEGNALYATLNARLLHVHTQLRTEIDQLRRLRAADLLKLEAKQGELAAVRKSRSWRLTAPLRAMGKALRGLKAPKSAARGGLEAALGWIRNNPKYKPVVMMAAGSVPPLRRRLAKFANARKATRSPKVKRHVWALDPDPIALRVWNRLLGVE